MNPYEPDISRVRAMYRLPLAAGRRRVLELRFDAAPVLADAVEAQVTDAEAPLPFDAASFDLVVLHETLDRLAAAGALAHRDAAVAFVERVGRLIAAGGSVAGCVENRSALARAGRPPHADGGRGATFSLRRCRAMLVRAGYRDVQLFSVLPHAGSPLRLINADADLSRIGFRRELDAIRASLGALAYAARRLAVELALNRHREQSILFWARRP
jgi:hypothetical protein